LVEIAFRAARAVLREIGVHAPAPQGRDARIDGHAEGGVDFQALEFDDSVDGGDAAGGGDFEGPVLAEAAELCWLSVKMRN
jgi:hypothetical protein